MWWISVAISAIAVLCGAGLIRYGLSFASERTSHMSKIGILVPPGPADQRGTLVTSGAVLLTLGLIAALIFFCIAMSA